MIEIEKLKLGDKLFSVVGIVEVVELDSTFYPNRIGIKADDGKRYYISNKSLFYTYEEMLSHVQRLKPKERREKTVYTTPTQIELFKQERGALHYCCEKEGFYCVPITIVWEE